MEGRRNVFFLAGLLTFGIVGIYGRPTEPSHSFKDVDINKNTTLECLALKEAMENNETYVFVKWYIRTDNGITSSWKWFAGMTQSGGIKAPKGFNISKVDGSLYIDKARPCDARKFMCKVERNNGRSPKDHRVTLRLREGNVGNETKTPEQRKNDKLRDCECKKEPHQNDPTPLVIVICVLSVLLLGALAFIVFQNWSVLREFFCRCTHLTGTQAPDALNME